MIHIHAFKEKRREIGKERPLISGQWKVPNLVALERNLMLKGQWETFLFSGQWKVPSLVPL
jgi:hypothetical protein